MKTKIQKWLPVDFYLGGAEHACLHLMYTRFITMALHDRGHIDFEEPFHKFRAHGHVMGPDGQKMSKSKGNVINPDDIVAKYGADATRAYLMFIGPVADAGAFNPDGITGITRFLDKFWTLVEKATENKEKHGEQGCLPIEAKKALHKTIAAAEEGYTNLKYNTVLAKLMTLVNESLANNWARPCFVGKIAQLLAPIAPHIAEEAWELFGNENFIFDAPWPKLNPAFLIDDTITLGVQINGKMRGTIDIAPDADTATAENLAKSDEKIAKYIENGVKKTIYIPGKILNFVV